MTDVLIQAADHGQFSAYLAEPKGAGKAPGMIVIQEIFGINGNVRAICDDYAAQGYVAIAPDLFWRQEPGVNISDKTEAEWKKAFALMNGLNQDLAIEDLKVTLAAARKLPGANGLAATMGFCLGGRLAVMMATRSDADANISYYGVMLDNLTSEFDNIASPLMLHIAEKDEYVPPSVQETVLDALEENEWVDAFIYPGVQHAFARPGGIHYDARAAVIANGRTAELLAEILE